MTEQANPHGREAVHVFNLRQELRPDVRPQGALAFAHGRTAVHVHPVQEELHHIEPSADARTDTQRRGELSNQKEEVELAKLRLFSPPETTYLDTIGPSNTWVLPRDRASLGPCSSFVYTA
jgi:hypothetical protein